MELTEQDLEKGGIIKYKAEKVVDGTVADTFEDCYSEKTAPKFSHWKYTIALEKLNPNGAELRFYINDVEQLLNC